MEHQCKQENNIKELTEFKGATEKSIENIEKSIGIIRDNDLKHIYDEIKCIVQKLSKSRPTWAVTTIITLLTALCSCLITALAMTMVASWK